MDITSNQTVGLLGLDPRTHFAAIVGAGAATMVIADLRLIIMSQIIAAVYLILNGRVRLSILCTLWFAVFFVLGLLPIAGVYGEFIFNLIHAIPPFTVGCALFTQSPSAIMCALEKWHVPKSVTVGICMAFRFGSLLVFEIKSVINGIRMRSIFPHVKDAVTHPALAYECIYVPLVMRSLRLSSELAASARLKGIEIHEGRTSVHHVGFELRDAAAALIIVAIFAALIVWDMVI